MDKRKDKITALEIVVTAAQILIVICIFKGNPAWKGSLSILFIGAAAKLFYKYKNYEEMPCLYTGIGIGIIGIALMFWFAITG